MRFCTVAFNTLYIYSNWYSTCCASWLREENVIYRKGVIHPQEIWNATEFSSLRDAWAGGDESLCAACPLLGTADKNVIFPHDVSGPWIEQAKGGPRRIYLSNEQCCNLHCWTCRQGIQGLDPESERREADMTRIIWEFRHNLEWLSLLHTGDPFASPMHMRLMQSLNVDDFPKMYVELFTNGILLPDRWSRLVNIHSRVKQVSMSIDASTKDTYEQVRSPAKWDDLLRAMRFVRDLRSAGLVKYFQCNFVARRSNYKESPAFVDLCREHGATKVRFSIFDRTWMNSEDYERESIGPEQYAEIVSDPRMSEPWVNSSILKEAAKGGRFMA